MLNSFTNLLSLQVLTMACLQIPFNCLIKSENTKIISFVSIFIAFLSFSFGYFVTPIFGYYGLIISNTIVNTFGILVSFYIVKINL
jgi:hypothetical protein